MGLGARLSASRVYTSNPSDFTILVYPGMCTSRSLLHKSVSHPHTLGHCGGHPPLTLWEHPMFLLQILVVFFFLFLLLAIQTDGFFWSNAINTATEEKKNWLIPGEPLLVKKKISFSSKLSQKSHVSAFSTASGRKWHSILWMPQRAIWSSTMVRRILPLVILGMGIPFRVKNVHKPI